MQLKREVEGDVLFCILEFHLIVKIDCFHVKRVLYCILIWANWEILEFLN